MAYGFIVEKKIAATEISTLNASATCATNVDGGNAVVLGAYAKDGYTVTLAGAAASAGTWMAYNPTEQLTAVGSAPNVKYFAGLSVDPRDYTNLAGRQIDIFKPQVDDIIGFTAANFGSNQVPDTTTNKYITTAANGQLIASGTAIAAGKIAFQILEVATLPFPQSGVGMEFAPLYVCKCTAN